MTVPGQEVDRVEHELDDAARAQPAVLEAPTTSKQMARRVRLAAAPHAVHANHARAFAAPLLRAFNAQGVTDRSIASIDAIVLVDGGSSTRHSTSTRASTRC